MSIIGDGIMLGAGGDTAKIQVTGVAQTDTVTCTKGSKNYSGKWRVKPNPAYHNLPNGYTELEYIESTGAQYLEMGYSTTNAATLAKMSFEVTCSYYDIQAGSTDELVNGHGNAYLGFINGKFYAAWGRSAGTLADSNIVSDNLMHTWLADVDEKIIKFDDIVVESNVNFTGLANSYGSLYLFGYKPSALDNCRIAGSKLKYNGAYIRNYIPCRRNSDGAIGMYDLCGSASPFDGTPFYGNSGTGDFIAGNEVPDTIYYREFTVNSYGDYTITASDGTDTRVKSVLVDAADVFAVDIVYTLWLYKDGVSYDFEDFHLYGVPTNYGHNWSVAGKMTTQKIDLSKYSKIAWSSTIPSFRGVLFRFNNITVDESYDLYLRIGGEGGLTYGELSLDDINDTVYVGVGGMSGWSQDDMVTQNFDTYYCAKNTRLENEDSYFDRVWLE